MASSNTLTSALLLGGLATGGFLLYRSAHTGAQQGDVWAGLEDMLRAVLQEESTTIPKPNTTAPTQTEGVKTNSLGDPIGTTYQVGDPHPRAAADGVTDAQDSLRVVHVDPSGTSPIFSSLPKDVINAFLAQFKQ